MGRSVTITVVVEEPYLKVLAKWASVQRTITQSAQLLENYSETLDQDKAEYDDVIANIQELEDIGPAINYLHMFVRGKIWEAEQQKNNVE